MVKVKVREVWVSITGFVFLWMFLSGSSAASKDGGVRNIEEFLEGIWRWFWTIVEILDGQFKLAWRHRQLDTSVTREVDKNLFSSWSVIISKGGYNRGLGIVVMFDKSLDGMLDVIDFLSFVLEQTTLLKVYVR